MLPAQSDHKPEEFQKFPVFLRIFPVQPGDFIILAVGVVVSILSVSKFIPGKKHWCPSAAHENRAGVLYHPEPQCTYFRIVGLSLFPTVPASVVITSVGIVPSVGLI